MFVTTEQKVLQSVAMQLMNGEEVALDEDGQKLRVKRVGSGRLRTVQFKLNGRMFEAIEQNRMKPSRWGNWHAKSIKWCSFGMWLRVSMSLWRWMGRLRSMGEADSTLKEHDVLTIPVCFNEELPVGRLPSRSPGQSSQLPYRGLSGSNLGW